MSVYSGSQASPPIPGPIPIQLGSQLWVIDSTFAGSDCAPQALAPGADMLSRSFKCKVQIQIFMPSSLTSREMMRNVLHVWYILLGHCDTLFTELQATAVWEIPAFLFPMTNVQLAHYTVCQAVAICHALQLVWEHLPPEALSSELKTTKPSFSLI